MFSSRFLLCRAIACFPDAVDFPGQPASEQQFRSSKWANQGGDYCSASPFWSISGASASIGIVPQHQPASLNKLLALAQGYAEFAMRNIGHVSPAARGFKMVGAKSLGGVQRVGIVAAWLDTVGRLRAASCGKSGERKGAWGFGVRWLPSLPSPG
jgi:hypothetical protein